MEVTVVKGRLMQTAASVCVFRLWLVADRCAPESSLFSSRLVSFLPPHQFVLFPLFLTRAKIFCFRHFTFENSLMSPLPHFDAPTSSFSRTVTR